MTTHMLPPLASTPATTRELHSLRWLIQPVHPATALASPTSQDSPPIPLWEWAITRDHTGASAGISYTRHDAIQALTRALTQHGRPRTGHIVPVLLIETATQSSGYLRGNPDATAHFDGKAIRWT